MNGARHTYLKMKFVNANLFENHEQHKKWWNSCNLYVLKDSGACLFGCERLSRSGSCCGPHTASPFGHRCTVGVLAKTHRCALMPGWHQARAPTLRGCWSVVLSMSRAYTSQHVQRDFTLLCTESNCIAFPCLTRILDSWPLECENTYTPARRVALSNLDRCALHLVRNLSEPFLLAACSATVHLVHPDADPFHSQEIAQHGVLSRTAAPSAALEKLPHRPLW